MKKIIRLTENDIHMMVNQAIKRILAERHVLEVPHSDDKMGDDMPMGEPMGGDDQMMNDVPPMDGNDDAMPMDDSMDDSMEPNEGGSEIDDIMSKLSTEQQSSVIKYAKSMVQDSDDDDTLGGDEPSMDDEMPAPMQEGNLKEFNNVVFDKREKPRRKKELGNVNKNSPFVSNR